MSKELEALMVLKQTIFHYTLGCLTTEEEKAFKVIENILKHHEDNMSNIIPNLVLTIEEQARVIKEQKKVLKALEIIKRCPEEVIEEVEAYYSFEELYEDLGKMSFIKNKEEFDLLKEVLL